MVDGLTNDSLMTTEEVAKYLNVSMNTLSTWRAKGGGPRSVKLGEKAVRYRKADVDDFIKKGLADVK